ncbi:MAG: hypothetical protein JKY80_00655 [Mariprofundaceae bacterium]|nr:hypothetical protein [Mariprofundaceae bacterium]
MSISWILISRFLYFANQSEHFNEILLERVEEKSVQLQTEHQKVQVLMQQEAKADERSRIMKDLHDGLGSYLMSAHSIARIQQLGQGIQQPLNDALFWLRTSIDTLDTSDDNLNTILGTFRHRIEPQLKACGIQLNWHMDDVSICILSAENKLHMIRIIQEAVTNVIKHAHASELTMKTTIDDSHRIIIDIIDNGKGMQDDKKGYGLKHMRERVESMGGSMDICSSKGQSFHLQFIMPCPM